MGGVLVSADNIPFYATHFGGVFGAVRAREE